MEFFGKNSSFSGRIWPELGKCSMGRYGRIGVHKVKYTRNVHSGIYLTLLISVKFLMALFSTHLSPYSIRNCVHTGLPIAMEGHRKQTTWNLYDQCDAYAKLPKVKYIPLPRIR